MIFELMRAGLPPVISKMYKNVKVTFDGKTFLMREVHILDESEGKITLILKWDGMDFVDYYVLTNGKFNTVSALLSDRKLYIRHAEGDKASMTLVRLKGWSE